MLSGRFDITRIMVVADAAMLTRDNQKMLSDKGLPFILGYCMKFAPAALRPGSLVRKEPTRHRRQE